MNNRQKRNIVFKIQIYLISFRVNKMFLKMHTVDQTLLSSNCMHNFVPRTFDMYWPYTYVNVLGKRLVKIIFKTCLVWKQLSLKRFIESMNMVYWKTTLAKTLKTASMILRQAPHGVKLNVLDAGAVSTILYNWYRMSYNKRPGRLFIFWPSRGGRLIEAFIKYFAT